MANQFIGHVEIPVVNLETAKEFYNRVFEWDLKPFGNNYYLYNTRAGITIGLRKVAKVNSGDTTIFHIHVDDIEKYCDRVTMSGGKLYREKTVIPVYGWYALINDTEGNVVGLYQSH